MAQLNSHYHANLTTKSIAFPPPPPPIRKQLEHYWNPKIINIVLPVQCKFFFVETGLILSTVTFFFSRGGGGGAGS